MVFEKDIFISYAHLDNNSLDDGIEGWITDFEKELRVVVGELLAKPPVIWRDEDLQGNDDFAPEIVAQFPKLKVMVSIVTPRYVTSEWCQRELQEFCKAAQATGGIKIENKSRIFKIHKTPVDLNKEPEAIRPYLGYDFYSIDPATEKFIPFDKTYGPEMERAYHAKILDVAQDITKLINKLGSAATNGNGIPIMTPPTSATKRKIYLADTTSDLKEFHEMLKRELEDRGYVVFPNKNLSTDTGDIFKSEAETFIKDSSLSIHLVGSSYGLVPDKTQKSIIVLQNEIAAKESAERGLNRLIWIPPSTTSDDARQQTFINQLHSEQLQEGSDLLDGDIGEFKLAIFNTITKQEQADVVAASKRKIYLAETDFELKEELESLKRELEERGYSVMPDKSLPIDTEDIFRKEAEAFIKDAAMSIHLIGSSYGLVPDQTEKSIVVLQNEMAAKESADRGLSRLIWIPLSTKPDDERQQAFIEELKLNQEQQKDSNLLEGTIEEFKTAVFNAIRKQEEKEKADALEKKKQIKSDVAAAPSSVTKATPRLIYLICDQRDMSDTKAIEDFLYQSGYEVMLPVFEGEEAQLRNEHEENLKQSDAVILYYGNANELWMRSMTRDLLRLPALGRTKPLLSGIAYLANPTTPQKERFRSNELTVVNGIAGFNPQLLNEFIGKLK